MSLPSNIAGVSTFPYLALEGCDGAGKSTVRRYLSRFLRSRKYPVLEIGQHSWLNIAATRIIIDARERRQKFAYEDIVNAYLIDKELHTKKNIRGNIDQTLILADRSIISDAVYQEALYGISADKTLKLYRQKEMLFPDILLYVEVAVPEAVRRIEKRSKQRRHYEYEPDLGKIVAIYERLLTRQPDSLARHIIRFRNQKKNIKQALEAEIFPRLKSILIEKPRNAGDG